MPPKKTGRSIKDVIGKEITLLPKYQNVPEGPYILIGYDPPLLGVHCNQRQRDFWFNIQYIVSFAEVKSVA